MKQKENKRRGKTELSFRCVAWRAQGKKRGSGGFRTVVRTDKAVDCNRSALKKGNKQKTGGCLTAQGKKTTNISATVDSQDFTIEGRRKGEPITSDTL